MGAVMIRCPRTGRAVSAKAGKAPPLGDRPLIVLTAGNMAQPGLTPEESAAVHKVWMTMHDEMAGLSTRGVNRVVEGKLILQRQMRAGKRTRPAARGEFGVVAADCG